MAQVFVVSLWMLSPKTSLDRRGGGESEQRRSCRHRYGCGRLVGYFHYVDIVTFTAEALHVDGPAEFSEIEGHNVALEVVLIEYLNVVEPFRSGLYRLMIWNR